MEGSDLSRSSTKIKVEDRALKLLPRLLREAHARPAISDFHDAATVYGNAGCAPVLAYRGAQQGNQGSIVVRSGWLLRPGFELGQLQEVPSIDRYSLDLRTGDR